MVGWVFLVNLFLFLLFLFVLKIIIISNSSLVTGLIVYDLWFLWIDTWPIDIIDYFIYHFFSVRRIKVLKIMFVNKYKSTDFNDFFSTNNRSIDRLIGWIVIQYVKKSFPLIKSLLEKKIASLTFFFNKLSLTMVKSNGFFPLSSLFDFDFDFGHHHHHHHHNTDKS